MRSLPWLALGAVLIAAAALGLYLLGRSSGDEAVVRVGPLDRGHATPEDDLKPQGDTSPKGGVYDGIVVEESGAPVEGARLLLVRYETGEGLEIPQFRADGSDFDVTRLPIVGAFEVSGETRSGPGGRFQVAAGGAKHRVKLVVAWTESHAPAYVFTGQPGEEVRVVLARGGHLRGTVVDPTGAPVSGALVQIFLQQIGPTPLEPGPGQMGVASVPGVTKLAGAPTLGDFLGRIIGPRVYGLDPGRTEALQVATRSDGTFHLGPIDGSVQLEVVISHADYMWTDFDANETTGVVVRPILRSGETLERTYRLTVGNWIEGRVVSDIDPSQGVEGVLIRLRHPVAYKKHHFYEYKSRNTTTAADGSFRMAGLSHPPYVADLFHPAFGSHFVGEIPANTKNMVWAVPSLGGLEGSLAGLETRPPGGRVEVLLEPLTARGPSAGASRHVALLSEQNVFLLERLTPGRYRISVRAASLASAPQEIEILPRQVARASFSALRGGSLRVQVLDSGGRAVDPATVTLVRVDADGASGSPLGTFVSRAGRLDEQGVAPGRYRLEASAPGYLMGASDVFEVAEGGAVSVEPLRLLKPGLVRLGEVRDVRGRAPSGDLVLEVREGAEPWRPFVLRSGAATLRPGSVGMRANEGAGATWADTFELAEGEVRTVEVTLGGG